MNFQTLAEIPLIPDEIKIPKNIEKKKALQIQAVFSSLEKQHKTKTANLWSLKYRKALLLEKKETKVFCDIMKELSQVSIFPLKDLALIKSYAVCPFEEAVSFDLSSVPVWLRLDLAKAFYKRRKLFDDPEQTLKATLYLAKNSPYKEPRTSYLKHVLTLIKEREEQAMPPVNKIITKQEEKVKPQENKIITKQEVQKLLYKESPSLDPQPKQENYLLIAEDFRERRKFQPAIQYYIKVLNLPQFSFEEKNTSFKGMSQIYRVQRNREKRLKNSNQWSVWLLKENSPKSLESYYKKKIQIARQKWNIDKNQEAISLLTELLEDKKSRSVQNKALLLRGSIYLQENQEDLSLKDWNQVIENLFNKKSKRSILAKALWNKAWIYRKRKKYKKALESFILLTGLENNPYTYYRALFWTGQTYEDLDSCFSSRRFFRKVAEKDPYGYYGLLANQKLGQKKVSQTEELPPLEIKIKPLIYWLDLFDENQLLSRVLEKEIQQDFPDKSSDLEEWLRVIWFWNHSGKYLEIFQSFQKMNEEVQKELIQKHAQLLFPLSFYKEIERASQKTKLEKSFILSIIRQESAFNVRARSPADAFGLMQLIPSTAKQVSKQNKIPYRGYGDLYRPAKNIHLGSAYLAKLLKKYDQNFILAVSAYNAGSTPVNKWKNELDFWTPLEFVENIPYEETRTYVRLIIRNYIFYHNLLKKQQETAEWFPKNLKRIFKESFSKCLKRKRFLL